MENINLFLSIIIVLRPVSRCNALRSSHPHCPICSLCTHDRNTGSVASAILAHAT